LRGSKIPAKTPFCATPKLLDHARDKLRILHYSIRSEEQSSQLIYRLYFIALLATPEKYERGGMRRVFNPSAVVDKMSASTQIGSDITLR
jgi:hypothetical protein